MSGYIRMIQRWLEESKGRGEYRDHEDKMLFLSWKHGEISLNECKKRFFRINDFPAVCDISITDEEFERWLMSEGW